MAECMLKALVKERGLENEYRVLSAGTYAASGAPASGGSLRAMTRRGLSLENHRSQPVTRALLDTADLVMGMGASHIMQLRMIYPDCTVPMRAFDDPPISDPYGGSDADYERAACDIQRQLPALLQP